MKTQISRKDLRRIYEIACQEWKSKIKEYGSKDPFSDTIEFTEKQVQEMLKASTAEQLPTVKEIFNIIETYESIKTLEDACKALGEKDSEVKTLRVLQAVVGLDRKVVSGQELVVITRALNDKWVPDWEDSSEYKYYSWFDMRKNSFGYYACTTNCSDSVVASRLCLKSPELAKYSANQFKNIHKEYMV